MFTYNLLLSDRQDKYEIISGLMMTRKHIDAPHPHAAFTKQVLRNITHRGQKLVRKIPFSTKKLLLGK
jgi:hypothetical protein